MPYILYVDAAAANILQHYNSVKVQLAANFF